MRRWLALWVIVPSFGCPPNFGAVQDADGGGGGEPAAPDANLCFGTFVKVCFTTAADVPTTPRMLSGEISTELGNASPLCDQHNSIMNDYCVVAGAGLTIASGEKIRAFGRRPLILLSTAGVDLTGDIDVSSTSAAAANPTGAGANPITSGMCVIDRAAAGNSGGAGGSFGGRGGDGEGKDGAQGQPGPAQAFPSVLRGGCPGGDGSTTQILLPAGHGGSGGGAVAIIAATVQLNGKINASGAGGHGGPAAKAGAGGGGSGGMIVVDVPAAAITRGTGILYANGGGGAEGGPGATTNGQDGGEAVGPTPAAVGGDGGGDGGNGGPGSAGPNTSGANSAGQSLSTGGGGGGGGGGGFIHASGLSGNMVISPPSVAPPQ